MSSLSAVRRGRLAALGGHRRHDDHEPSFIATPAVLEQIQREVAQAAEAGSHLRVAGRGHTRAPLCRCDDGLLQLSRFTGIEEVDAVNGLVWVRSGTRLSALARALAAYGLALPTLGWPGHESVGGAVSIGSYGIGMSDNCNPSPVAALRLVGADAATFSIGARDDRLPLSRVGLGTLGVVSHVALRCVAASSVQATLSHTTLTAALSRSEAMRAHDYVEWYWYPHDDDVVLRYVDRITIRGAHSSSPGGLLRGLAGRAAAEAVRVLRHQHERLIARRLPAVVRDDERHPSSEAWQLFSPSGMSAVSFALPVESLRDTLEPLGKLLRAINRRHRMLVRVRYARADDAALSPAQGRETAIVDAMMRPRRGHEAHLEAAAEMLARHDARPLWSMPHEHHAQELAESYPDWGRFLLLRAELDPHGLFLNDYLSGLFGVADDRR